ncbi:winged helix-turn-helix transcriptional regulator [Streptomyces sp. NPDC048172]|uniref:winged helix-turn-helix transcriptional regulator n=1 Tax=Streptomyces sp. NPDC048172 TaxID=3365505 RepID=UPI00371245CD
MAHQAVGHGHDHGHGHDGAGLLDACPGPDPGPGPDCPVEVTLAALRGRWTPLVLREFLHSGTRGYSELAQALPALSDKVLSERLAQLTRAGVLVRERTAGWPPRVTYTLTRRGRDLDAVLRIMWDWGAGGEQAADQART